MKAHPAADVFPLMEGPEFNALVADIAAHGLVSPIVTYDGKILDGRNRWRACDLAGVRPQTVEWKGANGATPTDYVVSVNLRRRHLSPDQLSCVAAELVGLFAVEAKERQREGGKVGGKEAGRSRPKASGKSAATLSEKPRRAPESRDAAGVAVGVSGRKVGEAMRVQRAAPAVFEKVKAGEMKLPDAVREVFPTVKDEMRSVDRELKDDPVVRWSKGLSLISDLILSVKTAGGMKIIIRPFTPEQRQAYKAKLIRVADKLRAYAEEL